MTVSTGTRSKRHQQGILFHLGLRGKSLPVRVAISALYMAFVLGFADIAGSRFVGMTLSESEGVFRLICDTALVIMAIGALFEGLRVARKNDFASATRWFVKGVFLLVVLFVVSRTLS